jgi:hypothetical protein
MNKTYIGIDNGVTGSIGIIYPDNKYIFFKTPVKIEQSYTKTKQNISRIDIIKLKVLFALYLKNIERENMNVMIERPMVNPTRFKATVSGIRALEATIILMEQLCISYNYIDSKEWQRKLLPKNCKGEELKLASLSVGKRLFPLCEEQIIKQKDADGLLIAEYMRRSDK